MVILSTYFFKLKNWFFRARARARARSRSNSSFTICTFIIIFSTQVLFAADANISEIKANGVSYDGKTIHLNRDVFIDHQFGTIVCDEAHLVLPQTESNHLAPETITLTGHVKVKLHDGATLLSDEAEIDCVALEGLFTAKEPNKVVYITAANEGEAPLKTSGRAIRVKMKKVEGEEGKGKGKKPRYIFSDIQGEGAVSIEYQPIAKVPHGSGSSSP